MALLQGSEDPEPAGGKGKAHCPGEALTFTYWRRKNGLMSGGDDVVCGFSNWLVATGSSSLCWLFQCSSRDLSTCRQ